MAKVPTPKAIDKVVLGGVSQSTSAKGPHRGGTQFNQMKPSQGFQLVKPIKGHSQQKNFK